MAAAEAQQEEVNYDLGDEELAGEDYDEEIPVEGSAGAMEGAEGGDPEGQLAEMQAKLQEMEAEAARLKALQQGDAGAAAPTNPAEAAANKEEVDSRSVFVGNVDYSCTPEELQQHFQSCGTVNRVTILGDKFGNPKGFAYIEFLEVDAVSNAILLDNTELRGRNIKVTQKRTNVPGLKQRGRGRGRGGHGFPFGGRGAPMFFMPMPMPFPGYGGGRGRGGYGAGGFAPRGRGRGGGRGGYYTPY